MGTDEGAKAPSYRNIAANDPENSRACRPSFEPPLHLRDQYMQEEMDISKESNTDVESSHPKAARVWIPENVSLKPRLRPGMSSKPPG
jgi:hypothetical protein